MTENYPVHPLMRSPRSLRYWSSIAGQPCSTAVPHLISTRVFLLKTENPFGHCPMVNKLFALKEVEFLKPHCFPLPCLQNSFFILSAFLYWQIISSHRAMSSLGRILSTMSPFTPFPVLLLHRTIILLSLLLNDPILKLLLRPICLPILLILKSRLCGHTILRRRRP